jgi:hypothetical protein
MADRARTLVHSRVNENTAAVHEQVAGVTGFRVALVSMVVGAHGAVDVSITDSDGTVLIGPIPMEAEDQLVLPEASACWCLSTSGQGLAIQLSAGVQVAGSITTRLLPDHFAL